ncbi:MAG TPA: NusG domain II-containing protein [Candidatus Atribacteria bacterium]|nr:NusG domain II-containing protein [Candidatus Atribacteria bacterium]HPU08678.1 NusG domain II-containing protein [Candidatus Atribacteria bacterium]HQE25426.1 NusG domain II-containing protein [Candidatus Atribacteria bacterium]
MKRQKWWAIISLFVVAGIWVGGRYISPGDSYAIVLETQTQTIELEVTPRVEKVISLDGPLGETIVEIKGGKVWVSSSPCPDKTCIKMGKIPDNGGFIACLPNRIIIRKREAKIFPALQQ